MQCKKCGVEIHPDAKFCENCGNTVEKVTQQAGIKHQNVKNNKRVLTKEEISILFSHIIFSPSKKIKRKKIIESLPFHERTLFELEDKLSLTLSMTLSCILLLLLFSSLIIFYYFETGVCVR